MSKQECLSKASPSTSAILGFLESALGKSAITQSEIPRRLEQESRYWRNMGSGDCSSQLSLTRIRPRFTANYVLRSRIRTNLARDFGIVEIIENASLRTARISLNNVTRIQDKKRLRSAQFLVFLTMAGVNITPKKLTKKRGSRLLFVTNLSQAWFQHSKRTRQKVR